MNVVTSPLRAALSDEALLPSADCRLPALRVALYNVTTTTKVGGVETFVWALAGHLAAAGHVVDVIGGAGGGGVDGGPGPGGRGGPGPVRRRGGGGPVAGG